MQRCLAAVAVGMALALGSRAGLAGPPPEPRAPATPAPLNKKVLQFAEENVGKQVGNGECAALVQQAFAYANARPPTPEEILARVWGRVLAEGQAPIPGDIVEFKDVVFDGKEGKAGFTTLFHTCILRQVTPEGLVLLNQNGPGGRIVHELDLRQYVLRSGKILCYRPVRPGTELPPIAKDEPKGSWASQVAGRVQYLSDMNEVEVRTVEGRFGKQGNLGYGAGNSYRIRVQDKESPHGISMCPAAQDYCVAKYRLRGKAADFRAWVALNDSAGAPNQRPGEGKIPSPVVFVVVGDGKELWRSEPVDLARVVQECSVRVAGVKTLELRVECPGSNVNAQAVWIEPQVVMR